jgi:hypothetical protein
LMIALLRIDQYPCQTTNRVDISARFVYQGHFPIRGIFDLRVPAGRLDGCYIRLNVLAFPDTY